MTREVSVNGSEFITVKVVGKRHIYYKGKKVTEKTKLPQNKLDKVVDSFEDGGNSLVNGYEFYQYGDFKVIRKVETLDEIDEIEKREKEYQGMEEDLYLEDSRIMDSYREYNREVC